MGFQRAQITGLPEKDAYKYLRVRCELHTEKEHTNSRVLQHISIEKMQPDQ